MTNDTAPIGYIQQAKFYFRRPAGVEVYIARLNSRRVGYLLLRHAGPTMLITEAVDERYRGIGVATRMVLHAQHLHADLTADILADNVASIRLHAAAGFALAHDDGRVRTYRYTRAIT